MPCRDDSPRDDSAYERLDRVTAMLCEVLARHEDLCAVLKQRSTLWGRLSPEVRKWWSDHKEADRVRREAEKAEEKTAKIAEKALAKLSPVERQALGLHKKWR